MASKDIRLPAFGGDMKSWLFHCDVFLSQITGLNDNEKFVAMIGALPTHIVAAIQETLRDLPADDKFTALTDALKARFVHHDEEANYKSLTTIRLGDRQPSELLREMKRLNDCRNAKLPASVIRSMHLSKLPVNMQSLVEVIGAKKSDEEYGILADRIFAREATARNNQPDMWRRWINVEKMDLENQAGEGTSFGHVLSKEEFTPSIPATLSNSNSASVASPWSCKDVLLSCDNVQYKNGNEHGVTGEQCSTENLRDEVKSTAQTEDITSEVLLEAFKHLEKAMTLFKMYDSNLKRSSVVNANLVRDYACYTELYNKKEKASKQLLPAISKPAGAAASELKGAKEANEKPHSRFTFKTLPRALSDSIATYSQSHDKSEKHSFISPVNLKDKSCCSTEDNVFKVSPGVISFDLVVEPPLSEDTCAHHTIPKKKSSSKKTGACSKGSTGPSDGKIKTTKASRAELEDSFDAETITVHNPIVVYFDLETTGLYYAHEIVQVSCICSCLEGESTSTNFDVYALPLGDFDPIASSVTKLEKKDNSLYLNKKKVPSVSLLECLTQFVSWLQSLPRPALLVGHNVKRFDALRLLLALWNCNLLHTFQDSVWGFADSLLWAKASVPKLPSYRLEDLSALYCPSDMNFAAHNAINDCLMLEVVVLAIAGIQPRKRGNSLLSGAKSRDASAGPEKPEGAVEINRADNVPCKNDSRDNTHRGCWGPGQNNSSSATANLHDNHHKNVIVEINSAKNQCQASESASVPCSDKTALLKSLQPYVFSPQSVMVGLKTRKASKVHLSASGS